MPLFRRSPPTGYHDLLEAFPQEGCPLCRLSQKAVAAYIESLLYESVNDYDLRARLRRSRGLCHTHAWQMTKPGSSLGAAIIQNDVLGELLRVVEQQGNGRKGDDLAQALAPQGECPACRKQADMEQIYLEAVVQSVDDDAFWQAYTASAGPCLPHFQALLRASQKDNVRQQLIAAQQAFWQQLREELAEFIRKNDYRFRSEGFGPEGDSWQRAIAQVVGRE